MKKWNWFLGETIVENENWLVYSIETLEQIRKDTLEYYENKYDIKGICEDLLKYFGTVVENFGIKYLQFQDEEFLLTINKNYNVVEINYVQVEYVSGSHIIPGEWIDWLLKIYEKNLPEINEKKRCELATKKEKFIKNYFTKGIL